MNLLNAYFHEVTVASSMNSNSSSCNGSCNSGSRCSNNNTSNSSSNKRDDINNCSSSRSNVTNNNHNNVNNYGRNATNNNNSRSSDRSSNDRSNYNTTTNTNNNDIRLSGSRSSNNNNNNDISALYDDDKPKAPKQQEQCKNVVDQQPNDIILHEKAIFDQLMLYNNQSNDVPLVPKEEQKEQKEPNMVYDDQPKDLLVPTRAPKKTKGIYVPRQEPRMYHHKQNDNSVPKQEPKRDHTLCLDRSNDLRISKQEKYNPYDIFFSSQQEGGEPKGQKHGPLYKFVPGFISKNRKMIAMMKSPKRISSSPSSQKDIGIPYPILPPIRNKPKTTSIHNCCRYCTRGSTRPCWSNKIHVN